MSGLVERTVHTTDDQLLVFSDRRLDAESSKAGKGVELRLGDVTEIDGREWIKMTLSDGSSRFALCASVRSHTNASPEAVPSAPAVRPVVAAGGTATAATAAPSTDSPPIAATPAATQSRPAKRSGARLVCTICNQEFDRMVFDRATLRSRRGFRCPKQHRLRKLQGSVGALLIPLIYIPLALLAEIPGPPLAWSILFIIGPPVMLILGCSLSYWHWHKWKNSDQPTRGLARPALASLLGALVAIAVVLPIDVVHYIVPTRLQNLAVTVERHEGVVRSVRGIADTITPISYMPGYSLIELKGSTVAINSNGHTLRAGDEIWSIGRCFSSPRGPGWVDIDEILRVR